ncbi:ankyrin [Stereum hirsutum FP-91666 SS1]|uniref:ankyrin n=1 Tax=Stereum hirsutum (strain FP-91666) TaxID=721885 RepID=UPI000440AB1F|nr:ankyrin [Stereum hirsutum FP-91666 SS1]EIM92585.1 ankyrin [Stereum hirsutum FP-91666 SS1]
MSDYTPSPTFHEAASYLSKASSLSQTSNALKLELYGLFKVLTISPTPIGSRPSFFDMTARAKWDAWAQMAKDYEGRVEGAETRYLEIARGLGWKEGAPLLSSESSAGEDADGRGGGTGMGMGVSVSVLSAPALEADEAGTLHGLVVENDLDALSALIEANPTIDLNAKDEYGYTPLHLACDRGNVAIAHLLLQHGVDQSIQDPDEFTAKELANVAGHDEIAALLS